jgi:ABC-2 type transport system ATP-binding protein
MESPLIFDRIGKRFGSTMALADLSLAVQPGEILGFLGPNGAGKTTALHLALGFLQPTSGSGRLLGKPFGDAKARARVGFAPDAPVFFGGNALDSLALASRLSGKPPARPVLESALRRVGIDDLRRDVRKFSRGMQQRLGLAATLVHDPELLILDEPAAALDPPGVAEIRAVLAQLHREGKTVLLSSHQLAEVEHLCDRIAFLREGRLLYCGSLRELLRCGDQVEIVVRDLPCEAEAKQQFGAAEQPDAASGETRWLLPAQDQRRAIELAWAAGATLLSVRPAERSLAQIFAEWTFDSPPPAGPTRDPGHGNSPAGDAR